MMVTMLPVVEAESARQPRIAATKWGQAKPRTESSALSQYSAPDGLPRIRGHSQLDRHLAGDSCEGKEPTVAKMHTQPTTSKPPEMIVTRAHNAELTAVPSRCLHRDCSTLRRSFASFLPRGSRKSAR